MLTISVTELVALLVLLPLFGGIVGYVVAGDRIRRAAGGKTPAELREEHEEYRAGVTAHFQETADLLGGMTDQYRQVYTHMARGAAELCETVEPGPRLEQLRSALPELESAGADNADPAGEADVPAPTPDAGTSGAAPHASRPAA